MTTTQARHRQQDERQQQAKPRTTRQRTPLVLRDVPEKGRGVFAGRAFRSGDEVLEFLGDVRDVDDYADLTHALQVGERDFLSSSGDVDDYVNHSCEPNCGIRKDPLGRIVLFALRPIRLDDEITFDYSTTQTGGFWMMDCQCGVAGCRQRIGDFKDLPQVVKDFYVARGAVLPFLLRDA